MFAAQPATGTAVGVAGVIALGAWRSGSLTRSGAFAALAVGVLAMRAGWGWGAFLIAWFGIAGVISRIGRGMKAARMRGVVAKGAERDASQVLANGGVFALCALFFLVVPQIDILSVETHRLLALSIAAAGTGALSAAGADTWATEFGTLAKGLPRSLRTRAHVPVGTSGAVSFVGTGAAIAGALVLAALASALQVTPRAAVPAVALSAVIGAFTDSVLGAWWQERRYCAACAMDTEQTLHMCGTRTLRVGGVGALDNDAVNFLCTLVGALLAGAFVFAFEH